VYEVLMKQQADGISLTLQQRDFLNTIGEEISKILLAESEKKAAKAEKSDAKKKAKQVVGAMKLTEPTKQTTVLPKNRAKPRGE
jgi:hypothetical protein